MREIFDSSRSDCGSGYEDKVESSPEITGWETEIEYQVNDGYHIIDYINKNISLDDLFSKFYYMNFEETYSPSGWTHKSCCPFPDHQDDTPSFGFNPNENRFFCFGCSRGGKAVQFVSWMDKITLLEAANKITALLEIKDPIIEKGNKNSKEIDNLLLSLSNKFRSFIKNNKDKRSIKFAEDLVWGVDIYLHKHVPRSTLDLANLRARVNIILKKLDSYEQKFNNR
jgi:hypothetical protein